MTEFSQAAFNAINQQMEILDAERARHTAWAVEGHRRADENQRQADALSVTIGELRTDLESGWPAIQAAYQPAT